MAQFWISDPPCARQKHLIPIKIENRELTMTDRPSSLPNTQTNDIKKVETREKRPTYKNYTNSKLLIQIP